MLNGKKILISSCAGMGDLLMFTPALRRLKELYPDCRLTFLTNAPNKDVLAGLPYIDKVATIERKKAFGRLNAVADIIGQDYVVFTDWQPQLLVTAYLAGVPHRIGITKPNHSLNKLLTKAITIIPMDFPDYVPETNARVFSEALDIRLDGDMTHYDAPRPSSEDVAHVDQLISGLGLPPDAAFICLAPFTALEERNWPVAYAKAFVQKIETQLGLPVVLIGPPHKREAAEVIGGYSLVGQTKLLEMTEVIRRARLFVGQDSGPMHIAGGVGTPLIALFSKDLPSRWAPRHKATVLTLSLPCSPCTDDQARNCKTLECIRGITPEMVFAAAEPSLASCQEPKQEKP